LAAVTKASYVVAMGHGNGRGFLYRTSNPNPLCFSFARIALRIGLFRATHHAHPTRNVISQEKGVALSIGTNKKTMATTTTWGAGLSQDDLMEKDTVIVLDNEDRIIGSASKKESHQFNSKQSHGVLHRAFSVFLFDEHNRLLLQQRASDKITFPDVWTNTCCSHPLHGMTPNEVDTPKEVANATVPGVKNAAVRKLQHELGMTVAADQMKFLTRLHYWASDAVTHGANSPW
jgi:isopentenyl-diphosphate delta-isomerase type 1